MDKVYEELVEARDEVEKLEEESRGETDSCQTLKISHDAQLNELQEAEFKVEKLDQELLQKEDEINDTKQTCEDLIGERNNMFQKLEEENSTEEEQFRKEQISSLQNKLDSQIAISEDLQNQLQLCNQALAAEQCQRKHLECEVSDFKDKDVEDLKSTPEAKEEHYKEPKNAVEKLEQENQKLRKSLRELQEAQIKESASSCALPRLRSELRNLEKIHKECVANFRARQAEWIIQLEQLTEVAVSCQSELQTKTAAVEDLKMELECSHSFASELMLLNEQQSVMLLVFKQGISEAEPNLFNNDKKKDLINTGRGEKFHQLIHQSEMEGAALISAQKDIDEECNKAACFMRQIGSDAPTMEKKHSLPNEIVKEMVEESTESFLRVKALQMEIDDSHEQLKEAYDAWDRTNDELAGRMYEIGEMELELQTWKFTVDRLKNDIEENLVMRKELENSLLAQVEFSQSLKQEIKEKENTMYYLQEQVVFLKQQMETRETEATAVPSETGEVGYLQIIEEKDKALEDLQSLKQEMEEKVNSIDYLQEKVVSLKQQLKTRDGEATAMPFETIEVSYLQIIEEKDKALEDLQSLKHEIEEKDKALEDLQSLKSEIGEKDNSIDYLQEKVVSLKQQLKTRDVEATAVLVPSETGEVGYIQIIEEKDKALEDLQNLKHEIEEKDKALEDLQSLKHEIEEKENSIDYLQERVVSLKHQLKTRDAEASAVPSETGEVRYLHIIEEKDKALEDLQSLKHEIEEKDRALEDLESLKHDIEEKENSIDYLQEKVVSLKQQLKTRDAEATAVPSETGEVRHIQIIEEKDKALEDFQEQEYMRRERDSAVTTKSSIKRTSELDKENPDAKMKNVRIDEKVKSVIIDELMDQVISVEDHFTNSLTYCSSQLVEKQAKSNQLQEACDKITAAGILAALKIEEKKFMIMELEDDIRGIEQKLKLQERNWSQTKQLAMDIDAEMDAKKEKIKELTDQMENNQRGSDTMLQELQMENRNLLENATRLSSESFDNDSAGMILEKEDGFLVKENMIMHSSTEIKNPETISDIR